MEAGSIPLSGAAPPGSALAGALEGSRVSRSASDGLARTEATGVDVSVGVGVGVSVGAGVGVGVEVGATVGGGVGVGAAVGVDAGVTVGRAVGRALGRTVGLALAAAVTTIVPNICSGWIWQKYRKVPAVTKVNWNDPPGSWIPESKRPSGDPGEPDVTV
jgi:hypothetical protein